MSTYTLDVQIEEYVPTPKEVLEGGYPTLFVRLTTQSMPEKYDHDPHMEGETHPFALLAQGKEEIDLEDLSTGIYEEYFPDNVVTRAILEMLRDPEKIKKGAGCCEWTWMRARLIEALDLFWD